MSTINELTSAEIRSEIKTREFKKTRALIFTVLSYFFLSVGAIIMIYPFVWMLNTSLAPQESIWEIKEHWWQYWIPMSFNFANYEQVLNLKFLPFVQAYVNSLLVSGLTTIGVVFTSSLAGYAFARLNFPGRERIFYAYLGTMMIPGAVTMIPVFILLEKMHLIDTYWAVILPAMFTAYGTFMLRQFFMTLPKDLEDAAKIDGCSLFGIYRRIILPLSMPALATLGTFTFMGSWMSFMWPLIVLNSKEKYTLPVLLSFFQSQYNTNYTMLMAASMMYVLPIIVVFLVCQRFFVEGIKLSGIKG